MSIINSYSNHGQKNMICYHGKSKKFQLPGRPFYVIGKSMHKFNISSELHISLCMEWMYLTKLNNFSYLL